jgi:hypothetical protein
MSTYRYSGEIRIRITYLADTNPNGRYRCFLQAKGGAHTSIYVNLRTSILAHAVDSPEAFDEVARAAIAFAQDDVSDDGDDTGWDNLAAHNEDGYHVARSANAFRGLVKV